MNAQARYAATDGKSRSETVSAMFDVFARGDGLWWPFRSVSKAVLQTQRNAAAYLEANRKLLDEMRAIVRKEQDIALEISGRALEGMMKPGWPSNEGPPNDSSGVFDRAMSRIRELGEAWIGAQLRSLETMRAHAKGASHHN